MQPMREDRDRSGFGRSTVRGRNKDKGKEIIKYFKYGEPDNVAADCCKQMVNVFP